MKKDVSADDMGSGKARSDKKPYFRPKVQEFGKLHLLTRGVGTVNGDAGQNMMVATGSDRAIKERIVQVGTHSPGIGLYLFDYKPQYRERWGHGRHLGVMADEVETVLPDAVSVHPDGYKVVDYAKLRRRHSIQ